MWCAIDDVQRDDASIMSVDRLSASSLHRAVVDTVLVVFSLNGRMNFVIESMVGALMQDDDDGSLLSGNLGRCINKLERIEFMVVNASDVNFSFNVGEDWFYVITKDASIGSPVNQSMTAFMLSCLTL